MSLLGKIKDADAKVKENIVEKRYIQNYFNDILAGNTSRTPVYVAIDNLLLGVSEEKVLQSALNTVVTTFGGFGFVYAFGNSLAATFAGDIYAKHKKAIDATYSFAMTFALGMGVNLVAGYSLKESVFASGIRAAIGIPLGPLTRWYTDSFREICGEPVTAAPTQFGGKPRTYSYPRAAAMIGIPVAVASAALHFSPEPTLEDMVVDAPTAQVEAP